MSVSAFIVGRPITAESSAIRSANFAASAITRVRFTLRRVSAGTSDECRCGRDGPERTVSRAIRGWSLRASNRGIRPAKPPGQHRMPQCLSSMRSSICGSCKFTSRRIRDSRRSTLHQHTSSSARCTGSRQPSIPRFGGRPWSSRPM